LNGKWNNLPQKFLEVLPHSLKTLGLSHLDDVEGFSTLKSFVLERLQLINVDIFQSDLASFIDVVASVSSVYCDGVSIISEAGTNSVNQVHVINSRTKQLTRLRIYRSDDLVPHILKVLSSVESLGADISQAFPSSSISSSMFPRLQYLNLSYKDKDCDDLQEELSRLRENVPTLMEIELDSGVLNRLCWSDPQWQPNEYYY
jgi:hypothetical protein